MIEINIGHNYFIKNKLCTLKKYISKRPRQTPKSR